MDIEVTGYVEIRNGDTVVKATNHFVDALAKTIISLLGAKRLTGDYTPLPTDSWSIYLGSDTSTPTTHDMKSLVSPIGSVPGTNPNSKSGSLSNPSAGVWRVMYSATWVEGSISGTVGEAALYLTTTNRFSWSDTFWSCGAGENMVSRLSAKDGDFSAFVIDTSKPIVVEWTVEFKGV